MLGELAFNTNEEMAATFQTQLELAEAGDIEAQFYVGYYYFYGQGVAQDTRQAVEWYHKAAEQGDAAAQNNLGVCYLLGEDVEKDAKQAVKWYRKAAEQGDAAAQNNLGVCYLRGEGVEKDAKQAVKWYRKAAEQGCADAQNNLGVRYFYGEGVKEDAKQAVKWYCKAAEQGHTAAQNNLGVCYLRGEGVEKDVQQAVEWYRKAAEQGYAVAQNNLGVRYFYGEGVKKDVRQAVEWYRKAAAQGYVVAQHNLGWCYSHGEGVEKDAQQAVEWFRKAATHGYAVAQHNLGWCYSHGEGVEKDAQQAVEWLRKAAEQVTQQITTEQKTTFKEIEAVLLQQQKTYLNELEKILRTILEEKEPKEATSSSSTVLESGNTTALAETKTEKSLEDLLVDRITKQCEEKTLAQLQAKVIDREREKLAAIEQQLKHLKTQFETNQSDSKEDKTRLEELWKIYKQQKAKLEAQKEIEKNPRLALFYTCLRSKLNQHFASEIVRRESTKKTLTSIIGALLGVPTGGLSAVISKGLIAAEHKTKIKERDKFVNQYCVGIAKGEAMAERIACALTLRYQEAIKKLAMPSEKESLLDWLTLSCESGNHVKNAAEYAAACMRSALPQLTEQAQSCDHLEALLIDCVFEDARNPIASVAKLGKHKTILLCSSKEEWNVKAIFCCPGIQTPDGKRFYNPDAKCCNEPKIFGCRAGSYEEVNKFSLKDELGFGHVPAVTGANHFPHPVHSLNSYSHHSSRAGDQKNSAIGLENKNEYTRHLQERVVSLEERTLKQERELQELRELVATLLPTPMQSSETTGNSTIKLPLRS